MARLGVDLGGTKIEAIILGDQGQIMARRRVATPSDYLAKLDAIRSLVHAIEAEAGVAAPLPAGIGHPGSLNPRTGLMRNANSTELNGHRLDADLARTLERPVRLANDANCFALSEARDGAGAGAGSVFGVILGTGVGGGMVLNGQLIEGSGRLGGEWGHTGLPWSSAEETPGPSCKCGRDGCIEAWCSGPGLSADHRRETGQPLTAAEISGRASTGDRAALATLERHHDRVARGLSSVINIFDPEVIVLGGGLSNIPGIDTAIRDALPRYVFSDEVTTRICRHAHGDSSGVRGAAWLWPDTRGRS